MEIISIVLCIACFERNPPQKILEPPFPFCFCCTQYRISEDDRAEQALKTLSNNLRVYGTSHCSFNVTHLGLCVRNWGPLWATTTFSFESFNGTLLKYFNGTTHVPVQIMKRFLWCRSLSQTGATVMQNANDDIEVLFSGPIHTGIIYHDLN